MCGGTVLGMVAVDGAAHDGMEMCFGWRNQCGGGVRCKRRLRMVQGGVAFKRKACWVCVAAVGSGVSGGFAGVGGKVGDLIGFFLADSCGSRCRTDGHTAK
ncbi:hypothetical protein AABM17_2176 [Neisseria musculi]|uniref:Uncharacterized protein n=1 Tax=Neisseria musculi TaxID=1815583 RepID=A0A7H1M8B7_9NEIS|nr:hypothetical protein H7A79_2175 [Neisseria musculi]